MLKKNLFLLFCIYLFVVQTAICGLLRHENKFFILAGINLLVLLLISILSKGSGDEPKSNKESRHEHKEYEIKENVTHIPQRQKGVKVSTMWFFIISILGGILLWCRLGNIATHLRLLIAIAGAYIIYIILGKLFGNRVFNTRESWLYLVGIILSGIYSTINLFNVGVGLTTSQNQTGDVETGFVNEIEIIGSGAIDSGDNLTGGELSGEIFSGDLLDENLTGTIDSGINNTGVIENQNTVTTQPANANKLATFRDVIKFLLADEELITTTNVGFKSISKTDPDYAYFRTAYGKQMIGSDLNPNQNPSCETFVVMKGLVQGREVGTYSNVKQAYRKYASSHNLLPGCKYGSYIRIGEMK